MKTKLLQVTLYTGSEVYSRSSPESETLLEILNEKLVNDKLSKPKLLFKYYNENLKQIEYQLVELEKKKTRL